MKFNSNKGGTIVGLISLLVVFSLVIAIATGWILNVLSLVHATGFSGLLVARVVGIFVVPLGTVLGFAA